jgi:multiple sugar transport system substrate-binding protein
MKKLLIAMLMIFSVMTLSACGDSEADGKIEIEFWHLSPVGDESYSQVKQIIRDFNDSQDVYYVNGTGFSFWDYWDKLNVAVASNTAPDVGYSTVDDNVHRAEKGVLYNISDFIAADVTAGIATLDTANFYSNQLDFLTYDDDLFGLPFTATTRMLYYNLDHFAEVGLTAADVPSTWAELQTVAKQLDVVDGSDIERIGFDPTYGQGTYMGYLWQSGLDYFDVNQQVTLNTQGHYDVLDWMVTFNEEFTRAQLNAFGEANTILGIDPFAAGRVSMMIATDGLYQTLLDYDSTMNYAVAPIPLPDEDGVRVNWGSGFSLELYTNGRDLDETAQGSWEFTRYLMSKDVQVEYADAVGWIMGNTEAMAVVAEGNPIITALVEECEYAVDKLYVPYAPAWHAGDWFQFYDELKAGTMTVQETLDNAVSWYNEKQTNYNATQ